MSGIFKIQNTGFAAQAFKAIVLNPQRHFSHLPVRRCGGLLTVAAQNLQSRQVKIAPFTPLVQKATIVDEILAGTFVFGAYIATQVYTERRVVRDMLHNVERELRTFRMNASDAELLAYVNHLIETLEPFHLRYTPTHLKEQMMGYDDNENEVRWSRRKIDDVLLGLQSTRERIHDLKDFNDIFLEVMHYRTLWPKFLRTNDGFSVLGAVMPPEIKRY